MRHATSFLLICGFGYLNPSEKLSFFSSPCKGDRFVLLLVQPSPLFKGSTCGAGVGLEIH